MFSPVRRNLLHLKGSVILVILMVADPSDQSSLRAGLDCKCELA